MTFGSKEIKAARELLAGYNLFLEKKLFKKDVLDKAMEEFMEQEVNPGLTHNAIKRIVKKIKKK